MKPSTLQPPLFQFLALDVDLQLEYTAFPSLVDIMPVYSSGTETGFDALMVDFSEAELLAKLRRFLDPGKTDEQVETEFSIGAGTARKLLNARQSLRRDFVVRPTEHCEMGMYRVFDRRAYYYRKEYLKTNSYKVMRNLMAPGNCALVAFRQQSQDGFHHVFVSQELGDKNAVSLRTREISYYFPLFILPDSDGLAFGETRSANLSALFQQRLRKSLGVTNPEALASGPTPEDIFHYAYAVFHSPEYRKRYADFLRSDFPRLPLPGSLALFRTLVASGEELTALHLMRSSELDGSVATFVGPSNPQVGRVGWSADTVWIDVPAAIPGQPPKSGTIGFSGVQEDVWSFQVGGYQVCEKWLKDRKGRTLSTDDVVHYEKIVAALAATIRVMREIDMNVAAHGGWPAAFALSY